MKTKKRYLHKIYVRCGACYHNFSLALVSRSPNYVLNEIVRHLSQAVGTTNESIDRVYSKHAKEDNQKPLSQVTVTAPNGKRKRHLFSTKKPVYMIHNTLSPQPLLEQYCGLIEKIMA